MQRSVSPLLFLVTILSLLPALYAQDASPKLRVLHTFPCNASFVCKDGWFPTFLTEAGDGSFYGIAAEGGSTPDSQGTVFKFTPAGEFSVIYSFDERPDGSLPSGASPGIIVEGTDGFLYGTTLVDGAFGLGTVFKLTKNGFTSDLHDFCNTPLCTDGAYPGFLMQGIDEKFYGSTGPAGFPTDILFSITSKGEFKVLHTFDSPKQPDGGGTFGFFPGPDGNFYGTTIAGAQSDPFNTVFRFNPANNAYKILYGFNGFTGFNNAPIAQSNIVQATTGELFGLQTNSVLYEVSTKGAHKEIGALTSTQYLDGIVLQASDGNLWGTFLGGDCGDQGQVFATKTDGTVLHNIVFDCHTDGQQVANILQAADGKLYGVTLGIGGVSTTDPTSNGTIWVIDAGLPKPAPVLVNFAPLTGAAGSRILLQGSHFVGTTAVHINGKEACFKLLTANFIRVNVPPDATTGKITITNAGGTTTSAKSFTVE